MLSIIGGVERSAVDDDVLLAGYAEGNVKLLLLRQFLLRAEVVRSQERGGLHLLDGGHGSVGQIDGVGRTDGEVIYQSSTEVEGFDVESGEFLASEIDLDIGHTFKNGYAEVVESIVKEGEVDSG